MITIINKGLEKPVSQVEPLAPIPVTVITGFLGSGKTTLLNRILTENHGMRIAVIENEFGEVGIDDALVLSSEEEIFEMNNGCICCTVRGDLIRILGNLIKRRDKFDRIVIETTGMADPAPVAQTFFVDDELRAACKLDAIITVVDAKHALQHLNEVKEEGVENESVEQIAFADRIVLNKTDVATEQEQQDVIKAIKSLNAGATIFPAVNANVDLKELLDIGAFDLQRIMDTDPAFLTDIEHMHDQSVTSVGIEVDGDLDIEKLNDWLGVLLGQKGTDIYRSKGILAIDKSDERYVFHAVHMLFNGEFTSAWGDAPRTNRMIFIGKNLNRKELTDSFMACMVSADSKKKSKVKA
jgi:G3E family GTPase